MLHFPVCEEYKEGVGLSYEKFKNDQNLVVHHRGIYFLCFSGFLPLRCHKVLFDPLLIIGLIIGRLFLLFLRKGGEISI